MSHANWMVHIVTGKASMGAPCQALQIYMYFHMNCSQSECDFVVLPGT